LARRVVFSSVKSPEKHGGELPCEKGAMGYGGKAHPIIEEPGLLPAMRLRVADQVEQLSAVVPTDVDVHVEEMDSAV
jgi:hypothetical protein